LLEAILLIFVVPILMLFMLYLLADWMHIDLNLGPLGTYKIDFGGPIRGFADWLKATVSNMVTTILDFLASPFVSMRSFFENQFNVPSDVASALALVTVAGLAVATFYGVFLVVKGRVGP